MESKQLFTFLAKVNSTYGSGYYGEMLVEDYKGQKFKVYQGNIGENNIKEWKGKWRFYNLEYRGEQLYYVKSMICQRMVYDLMLQQYREERGREMVAEREKNESIVSCDAQSVAGELPIFTPIPDQVEVTN